MKHILLIFCLWYWYVWVSDWTNGSIGLITVFHLWMDTIICEWLQLWYYFVDLNLARRVRTSRGRARGATRSICLTLLTTFKNPLKMFTRLKRGQSNKLKSICIFVKRFPMVTRYAPEQGHTTKMSDIHQTAKENDRVSKFHGFHWLHHWMAVQKTTLKYLRDYACVMCYIGRVLEIAYPPDGCKFSERTA